MATTSFDKNFVVTDKNSIEKFKQDEINPIKVFISNRDYNLDKSKGIELLKQQLLNLATY